MPKVSQDTFQMLQEKRSVIEEIAPGVFKGPWLPDYYDNRTECWKENIAFKREQDRKAAGQNAHGQTPEQEKAFKDKLRHTEILKEKAKVAEQMAINIGAEAKSGLKK